MLFTAGGCEALQRFTSTQALALLVLLVLKFMLNQDDGSVLFTAGDDMTIRAWALQDVPNSPTLKPPHPPALNILEAVERKAAVGVEGDPGTRFTSFTGPHVQMLTQKARQAIAALLPSSSLRPRTLAASGLKLKAAYTSSLRPDAEGAAGNSSATAMEPAHGQSHSTLASAAHADERSKTETGGGTQLTCFTGTNVRMLTRKALLGGGGGTQHLQCW